MHKCTKCGREAASLEEIDAGCPCGSKVFTFDRQAVQAVASEAAVNGNASAAAQAVVNGNGGNGAAQPEGNGKAVQEEGGKVPESYFARTTFTDDDIENIKVLTQGVFLLDVNAISKNPVVLKDEDEVYYVKLPLEQKHPASAQVEGNGKKE